MRLPPSFRPIRVLSDKHPFLNVCHCQHDRVGQVVTKQYSCVHPIGRLFGLAELAMYHLLEQYPEASCFLHLYETFQLPIGITLVLEYAPQGDMFAFLHGQLEQRLDPTITRRYFAQIAKAMHYMHSHGIVHGDLCLENIMLTQRGCCLADFGRSVHGPIQSFWGRLSYQPPECYQCHHWNGFQADMWMLGVVLSTLLIGHPLFRAAHTSQRHFQCFLENGLLQFLESMQVLQYVDEFHQILLLHLLVVDPSQRWTIDQVLSYLNGHL